MSDFAQTKTHTLAAQLAGKAQTAANAAYEIAFVYKNLTRKNATVVVNQINEAHAMAEELERRLVNKSKP